MYEEKVVSEDTCEDCGIVKIKLSYEEVVEKTCNFCDVPCDNPECFTKEKSEKRRDDYVYRTFSCSSNTFFWYDPTY